MNSNTHIAIIGAGPAGAIAATLLALCSYRVSLISCSNSTEFKAGETLPPNANDLLNRLSLSTLLQQSGHIPCPGNQSAFGIDQLQDVDFLFSPHGLGWHLDRIKFEQQLQQLAAAPHTHMLNSHKLRGVSYKNHQWQLHLNHNGTSNTLAADYVIDASGQARAFIKKLSIATAKLDHLAARIGVFHTDINQQDHRTLIESETDGWWYSTSAPEQKRVVMFFSDVNHPTFKQSGSWQNFLNRMQQTRHICPKVHSEVNIENSTTQLHFCTKPAFTSHAMKIQGQQWLAIGDAAMTFDPLSSQGMYTAMQAADIAVKNITELDKKGQLKNNIVQSTYTQWAQDTFTNYMEQRSKYYAMEQRWPQSAFWSNRGHSMLTVDH